MDPRLRCAVDASVGWYDEICALHRIPAVTERGLWRALGEPPPWHSAVKTVDPGVGVDAAVDAAVAAVESFGQCSVADSFGDLDLAEAGFSLPFEATWLHRPAGGSPGMPALWSQVRSPDVLAQWTERHDYTAVLPPTALEVPRLAVLARWDGAHLVGGAVLHAPGTTAVVGLSNAWAVDGRPLDWDELLGAAYAVHPGRPLTAYARGDDLAAMERAGFAALGPQRVWMR